MTGSAPPDDRLRARAGTRAHSATVGSRSMAPRFRAKACTHLRKRAREHAVEVAKASAATFPPPLRGRDREGVQANAELAATPPPHPSPARGEGGARGTRAASSRAR